MARRDEERIPEEREKVVVDRDRGGPGAIIVTVVALIILGLIIWLIFGLANDATNDGIDVDVTPEQEQTEPAPTPEPEPAPEPEQEQEPAPAPEEQDDTEE